MNGTGPDAIKPAVAANGTYDARALSLRASRLIREHDPMLSMFMYLAFHNVHVPMMAPLETVEKFPRITSDARKVASSGAALAHS